MEGAVPLKVGQPLFAKKSIVICWWEVGISSIDRGLQQQLTYSNTVRGVM